MLITDIRLIMKIKYDKPRLHKVTLCFDTDTMTQSSVLPTTLLHTSWPPALQGILVS